MGFFVSNRRRLLSGISGGTRREAAVFAGWLYLHCGSFHFRSKFSDNLKEMLKIFSQSTFTVSLLQTQCWCAFVMWRYADIGKALTSLRGRPLIGIFTELSHVHVTRGNRMCVRHFVAATYRMNSNRFAHDSCMIAVDSRLIRAWSRLIRTWPRLIRGNPESCHLVSRFISALVKQKYCTHLNHNIEPLLCSEIPSVL